MHRAQHGADEAIPLDAGMIFCIHAGGRHHFATDRGDEMRVIAYHPDSDCGPTDDDHPMVDGVSTRELDTILTTGNATLEPS